MDYATAAVTTGNKTCLAKTTVIRLERVTNGQDKNSGSLPRIIELFPASFTNSVDAVASKYDSVEEEEETRNEYCFSSTA